MRHSRLVVLAVAGALTAVGSARAQHEPPVNLGATSFLDGGPPVYFSEYLQYYGADRFVDSAGHALPFPGPRVNVWSSLSQVILLPDCDLPLLGAKPALDILLPAVSTDAHYDAPGPFPSANGFGLGDLLLGPALQFNPIMGAGGKPLFVHRLEAQFIIPTGKYSDQHDINPGSGFFSFDPYWAGTLFLGPKLELSYRAHYLWNTVNDSPTAHLGAHTSLAGEAFHTNFAASYEVIEKHLRVGVNGYYLRQTTDSELDGVTIPGREQVLGIGPGLIYSFNEKNHLFFNAYVETAVRDRTEGTRLTLRYVVKF